MSDDRSGPPSLIDIVDRETLEEIRTDFERGLGIPLLFADPEGRPLTEAGDLTRFCTAVLEGPHNPEMAECICCRRTEAGAQTVRGVQGAARPVREPTVEACPLGFLNALAPVNLNGQLLGYGLLGRALESAPDLDEYRSVARERGLDPEICVAMASNACIMPRERLLSAARLLHTIVELAVRVADNTLQDRRARELEEARDHLTTMIVHDMRTPLTAIIGTLRNLHAGALGALDDMGKQLVDLSLRNAKRLLGMVDDMLDTSKMEIGAMALNREPVQLRSILDVALEQVHYVAEDRDIELAADLPPDLPALYADRDRIDRVLVNLLGNAIKFSPHGGTVTVSASNANGDAEVLVAVADTGSGIPEDYRDRVFERFVQVESREARRRMSVGLGLAFCKMAVEAHGGRIWVESKAGEGSTFSFTL
ncbi:MAG: ATP-binding protein, partial [Armatimonadota bacterium]